MNNGNDLSNLIRITELVSLLSNIEFNASIKNISKITGTSLEQTRKDIITLNKYGISIAPEKYVKQMSVKDPKYDDHNLFIASDLGGIHNEPPYLLLLNKFENTLFSKTGKNEFLIKDTPYSTSINIQDNLKMIEKAIADHCCTKFRYLTPSSGIREIETAPVRICHNTTDDLWYCIAFPDDKSITSYRLDRIKFQVTLLPDKKAPKVKASDPRFKKLDLVWGGAFDNNEPVEHIKIRIEKHTANIIDKVRSDVSGRSGKWIEKETYCIYEDDIIGISAFKPWLRSFGASITVLEPKSLAKEMKNDAMSRLANYKADKFLD